jgi:hypothetical protein
LAKSGISGADARHGLDAAPKAFGHDKALKLKLFLVVPQFGNVRRKRTDKAA